MPQTDYDIFISYRTAHRPWVEALAYNLQAQGYKVFLDAWAIAGGQHFTRVIFDALGKAKYALLLATPDAAESGWVQDEYEYMHKLSNTREDFLWIPLVLGEFPDFPFLSNVQAIDFGNSQAETYRVAFQKLLHALKREPPGARPHFAGALQLPEVEQPTARALVGQECSFLQGVFSYLDASSPLMILAQAETSTQHYAHAVRQLAERRYGAENVLHVFPPASTRADSSAYFGRLAEQCDFGGGIAESWEWADALRKRLLQGQETLLLVTGFENGTELARAELAGELRGLLEEHPFELKLLVIGGERLAAMKYQHGAMSFLNKLEEMRLPQANQRDVREIYLQRYPGLQLTDAQVQTMLDFTGQHPRLLEACLLALRQGQNDWQTSVRHGALPSQLFTRFRSDADAVPLCGLLKQTTLGRYDVWPQDELVRRLYWQNLITDCRGQFVWRCDFIRDTGLEILGC